MAGAAAAVETRAVDVEAGVQAVVDRQGIVGKGYKAAGQVGVVEDVGGNVGCTQGACGYGSDVAAIGQVDP
jgi:hypothetical protein